MYCIASHCHVDFLCAFVTLSKMVTYLLIYLPHNKLKNNGLRLDRQVHGAVPMFGYECRNKSVFSLRRNTGNDGADVTSSERLFQTLGSAESNGWSPTVTSRDGRMSSRLEDADLNRLCDAVDPTCIEELCHAGLGKR